MPLFVWLEADLMTWSANYVNTRLYVYIYRFLIPMIIVRCGSNSRTLR